MSIINTILERIEAIASAEKVTKAELGAISRDILTYIHVEGSNDIACVNRLLQVLTPMNKRTAVLFFQHFLPFTFDTSEQAFGKKIKGAKVTTAKHDDSLAFLSTDQTIWDWAALNVKLEKKPVDYGKKIASDVRKALEDDENGITPAEVLKAVLAGGITEADLLGMLEALTDDEPAPVVEMPVQAA